VGGLEVNQDDIFDVTIIGGGPTGQYACYYAGLRGMKTKLIDSLQALGGQLTALYPEKYIYDVAGFPRILAKDLVNNLTEQMMQYEISLALGEKVTDLKAEEIITLQTAGGKSHFSKSVIITAGVGAFNPRKMVVPGIAELESKGVHYFVGDTSIFEGKRLVIVGGGDSAFDWAMHLSKKASSVVQIHRSDRFRAHEDTVEKVMSLPVELKTFYELKEVHGTNGVEGVTVFDNRTKEEIHYDCDAVLLNLGFQNDLGPIKEWGLEIIANKTIQVTSRMETNLPGVYAAGDIVDYPGKLKLIATGFGEAAIAVNHAKAHVDPSSKVNPGHSSENVPEKK